MKQFKYLVQIEEGVHSRPSTLIVTTAKQFESDIKIKKEDKIVDCKRMIALMSLNIKKGDMVEVIIQGNDEEQAFIALGHIFKENL